MRTLAGLRAKRQAGQLNFERVILEPTCMANPGPVCQTFFMDDDIAEYYRLDAVVTVVDAEHGMATLDAQPEAQKQVGFADRILVSKTDLVNEADYEGLRARLVRINARAPISPVNFGDAEDRKSTRLTSRHQCAVRRPPPDRKKQLDVDDGI